jgi:hypothetical protein
VTLEGQSHSKSTSVHTQRLDIEIGVPLDEASLLKEEIQEVIDEAGKPGINEKQGNTLDELQMFIKLDAIMVSGSKVPDSIWAYICATETTSQNLQELYNDEDDQDSYRLYITLQDTEIEDSYVLPLEQVLLHNNTGELLQVKIRAKTSISQWIEHAVYCDMSKKSLEDWVPKMYLGYRSVFEKGSAD